MSTGVQKRDDESDDNERLLDRQLPVKPESMSDLV